MRLLVTGAHGLLGRALLQTDWGAQVELVGCGRHGEPVGDVPCHAIDLGDVDAVVDLWRRVRPDRIIHTAALTNVDRCETEPELARRVNQEIVAHVVAASVDVGAGVAHLSTDYVFDGRHGPYSEQDQPQPLSVYGRTKLESESIVLAAAVDGLVVRTLWLYGHLQSVRPNLVTWPLGALARGESIRIVGDQWGNPTYVHDLARALVELSRQGVSGLFHMGGTTFLTRQELARQVQLAAQRWRKNSTSNAALIMKACLPSLDPLYFISTSLSLNHAQSPPTWLVISNRSTTVIVDLPVVTLTGGLPVTCDTPPVLFVASEVKSRFTFDG